MHMNISLHASGSCMLACHNFKVFHVPVPNKSEAAFHLRSVLCFSEVRRQDTQVYGSKFTGQANLNVGTFEWHGLQVWTESPQETIKKDPNKYLFIILKDYIWFGLVCFHLLAMGPLCKRSPCYMPQYFLAGRLSDGKKDLQGRSALYSSSLVIYHCKQASITIKGDCTKGHYHRRLCVATVNFHNLCRGMKVRIYFPTI